MLPRVGHLEQVIDCFAYLNNITVVKWFLMMRTHILTTLASLSMETGKHFTQKQVRQSLPINQAQEVIKLHRHIL